MNTFGSKGVAATVALSIGAGLGAAAYAECLNQCALSGWPDRQEQPHTEAVAVSTGAVALPPAALGTRAATALSTTAFSS
ncbi:hypothetical protein [Ramlibacter agri]|uniref:hypothetical protein n=1 Tax=Ramlibacter agri TaxID=2728837 RepID=UPI00146C04CF|nr:hypothetical protein [Ramlibacter agri]